MNKYLVIFIGCCLGGFIGSSIGIAAMGDAYSGFYVGIFVGGYIAYRILKNSPTKVEPDTTTTDSTVEQDPLEAIEKSVNDAIPLLAKFLGASWNIFMKLLIYTRAMPLFKRTPWLMIVLVIILMATIPPIGIFLCISGLVASRKGANAENNFMMPLN